MRRRGCWLSARSPAPSAPGAPRTACRHHDYRCIMIEQVKSVDWMARGAAFIERVPLLLLDDVKSRIVTMLIFDLPTEGRTHDHRIPDRRLARHSTGCHGRAAARDGGHRQRQLQQARHRRCRRGGAALHGGAGHPGGNRRPAEARRLPARRGAVGRPAGQCRRQHRADGPSRHRVPRRRGLRAARSPSATASRMGQASPT